MTKVLPWVVIFVLTLALAAGVTYWLRHPHGSDPIVDTVIVSTPAVHDSTAHVLARADSALTVSRARSDTIQRYKARARSREDSINALEAALAESAKDTTKTPVQLAADSLATCRQQLGLWARESQDKAQGLSLCERDQQALRDTIGVVTARLGVVQRRADSIPTFIRLAVQAAPCRRDWGLLHVPCWVQDVAEVAGGAFIGSQ